MEAIIEKQVSKASGKGRWITIGSKDVGGKRKGGSPVYIDAKGNITKGHRSLVGRHVSKLADHQAELKRLGVKTGFKPKTRLDRDIVETIGDDPDNVAAFRELLDDAHQMHKQEINEHNGQVRELLSHFGLTGNRLSGFLSAVRRARDATKIPAFDEMVQIARSTYPVLLTSGAGGESSKDDDDEGNLLHRLRTGFIDYKPIHHEEIFQRALEMAGLHDGRERTDIHESTPVPFAAQLQLEIDRYTNPLTMVEKFSIGFTLYLEHQRATSRRRPATIRERFIAEWDRQLEVHRYAGEQRSLLGEHDHSDRGSQRSFRWITIGGDAEGGKKHVGGSPVAIDGSGNIVAGHDSLVGKNLKSLDKNKAGTRQDGRKTASNTKDAQSAKAEGKVTINSTQLEFKQEHGQTFFRRSASGGWTAASQELADAIRDADREQTLNRKHVQAMRDQQKILEEKNPKAYAEDWIIEDAFVDELHKDLLKSNTKYRVLFDKAEEEAEKVDWESVADGDSPPAGEAEFARQKMLAEEHLKMYPEHTPKYVIQHYGLVDQRSKDLFGEEVKERSSQKKPEFESTSGNQQSMFAGLDSKPDQMNLWADNGIPDDLVAKGSESIPPETPSSVFSAAIEKGDSPREAAAQTTKALQQDYAFARSSAIGNAGEDLLGSARHNRNSWRGLDQAESDGTAEQLVTRANLLKNEPHDLMSHADTNPLGALAMHYAMNRFPAKPEPGRGTEESKKNRADYLEAYQSIKKKATEIAQRNDGESPSRSVEEMQTHVFGMIQELRARTIKLGSGSEALDKYNATANSLVTMYKSLRPGYGAPKNGVMAGVNAFSKAIGDKQSSAAEKAKDIIEGKSLNQAFGIGNSQSKKRIDPATLYVSHATRKGGRNLDDVTKNPVTATSHIVDEFGMRGVQWGNSVTDEERKHHAARTVESLVDLAEVVGLHPNDISLDGKLGLAIGARGRSSALAHYEPNSKVINLTRKRGVGTLAHEWGHAFDHMLGDFGMGDDFGGYKSNHTSEKRFQKDEHGQWIKEGSSSKMKVFNQSEEPIWNAMHNVRRAWESSGFNTRLKQGIAKAVSDGVMSHGKGSGTSGSKTGYWTSNHEKFARSFERFVQHKLHASQRENTYLSGYEEKNDTYGLWPNTEEMEKMAPAFEALFTAYRRKRHSQDEPIKFSRAAASRQLFQTIRYATIRSNPMALQLYQLISNAMSHVN